MLVSIEANKSFCRDSQASTTEIPTCHRPKRCRARRSSSRPEKRRDGPSLSCLYVKPRVSRNRLRRVRSLLRALGPFWDLRAPSFKGLEVSGVLWEGVVSYCWDALYSNSS